LEGSLAPVGLGVPAGVVLDEWDRLVAMTDLMAERFIAVFEEFLLPATRSGARSRPGGGAGADGLTGVLATLQDTATRVVLAALDTSISRAAARRLGQPAG